MAAPNRPLYSALFRNTNRSYQAVRMTEGFIQVATLMLRTLKRADVDRQLAQQSSQDLIDVILWLVSDAFRGIAERCNWALQGGAPEKRRFMNKINNLGNMAQALANGAGYQPLIPYAADAWVGWNPGALNIPNIAAQAPLELLIQTILRVQNPASHAAAIVALNNVFFRQGQTVPERLQLGSRQGWAGNGMSKCVFLCQGQAVLPPGSNNRWIAPMSDTVWGAFTDVHEWARDARTISRMTGPYRARLTILTNRVRRFAYNLGVAFRNGAPAGANGRLNAAWVVSTAAAPALIAPTTYDHLNDRAMSYSFPVMTPRSRCRRCRVIFRYTCAGEPNVYVEGIYPPFTCAEAVAYPMCTATPH